jgi:toxic protein SymE
MATHKSTQTTPPCHTRQIKIGSIMYDYRRKTKDNTQAIVPWLQLKGHWLARAGFTIDTPVTIQVTDGCLVLRVEPQANS